MIHTGSVSIGHLTGNYFKDIARKLYPQSLRYPHNGIFPLPADSSSKHYNDFIDSFSNSANFAFANRLFLGLMMYEVLESIFEEFDYRLLYDSPHNFLWRETIKGEEMYLHRKGACSANSFSGMGGTPFEYYGEPVFVPGSMGSPSYVMVGQGKADALWSASHGAGRSMSRGKALKYDEMKFKESLRDLRIVTPVNPNEIGMRAEIVKRWYDDLKKEAPYAYKNINDVVKTIENTNIARRVVEVCPIITLKG